MTYRYIVIFTLYENIYEEPIGEIFSGIPKVNAIEECTMELYVKSRKPLSVNSYKLRKAYFNKARDSYYSRTIKKRDTLYRYEFKDAIVDELILIENE